MENLFTDGLNIFDGSTEFLTVNSLGDAVHSSTLFNSYSDNAYPGAIQTAAVSANTYFSSILPTPLGIAKITLFSNNRGQILAFNRDLRDNIGSDADSLFNMSNYNNSIETKYSDTTYYSDLFESSGGFITASVITDFNQHFSNTHYLVNTSPYGSLEAVKFQLDANYVSPEGQEIIDCQNDTDYTFGNVSNAFKLFNTNKLSNSDKWGKTTGGLAEDVHDLDTSTNDMSILGNLNLVLEDSLKSSPSDLLPFKFIVVPVKTEIEPKNDSSVKLGVIVFDQDYDTFHYRFIDDTAVGENPQYLNVSNGFGEDNYSRVITHNLAADPSFINTDKVILSSFSGFSFSFRYINNHEINRGTFWGLKNVARRGWTRDTGYQNPPRFEGPTTYFGSTTDGNAGPGDPVLSSANKTYNKIYNQLPVAFGNRLMPLTNPGDFENIGSDLRSAAGEMYSFSNNAATQAEVRSNVGYFNIAYATIHGFILFRLHSYAPILLPPSHPDGIELHIPGGEWNYNEINSEGKLIDPIQDAKGYTPISMEFSKDNNFLYAIVAKPDEREIRFICKYSISTFDTLTITNEAKMVKNPFTNSIPKSIRVLPNGRVVIFSTSGDEYYISDNDTDTAWGAAQVAQYKYTAAQADFSVIPAKRLNSTATNTNTWRGSNVPLLNPDLVSLLNTSTLDSSVLTPRGFLDLTSPGKELSEVSNYTKDNDENWLSSILVNCNPSNPLVVYLEDGTLNNTAVRALNFIRPTQGTSLLSETHVLPKTFNFKNTDNILNAVKLSDSKNMSGISSAYVILRSPSFNNLSDNSGFHISHLVTHIKSTDELQITNIAASNLKVGDSPSDVEQRFLGNAAKIISLEGDKSYGIFLERFSDGTNLNLGVRLYNLSDGISLSAGGSVGDISMDTIVKETEPAYTNHLQALFTVDNPPTNGATAVSVNGRFIAAAWYNESKFGLQLYSPDTSAIISNLMYFNFDTKHFSAHISNNPLIVSAISSGYVLKSMEFSHNNSNLYLLFLHKTNETKFKIIKVHFGADMAVYFGGAGAYKSAQGGFSTSSEVADDKIELVGEYYFTSIIEDNLTLPKNVSADILKNTVIQTKSIVTDMFKGLDSNIYLVNKYTGATTSSDNVRTLGKIVNPNKATGSDTHPTKYIKAGILISPAD